MGLETHHFGDGKGWENGKIVVVDNHLGTLDTDTVETSLWTTVSLPITTFSILQRLSLSQRLR